MTYEAYVVQASTTAGETLTTESGLNITLNANGTISFSGAYSSEDYSGASGGSDFTKIFAFGYGQVAGQRSDGSLVLIGYLTEDAAHSTLLNNSYTAIKANYGAGAAERASGVIDTWGHSGYQASATEQFNDGEASFVISGTTQLNDSLSITTSSADPDGNGTFSYVWQSSSDGTTWSQISTNSTYSLTLAEEGKKIRALISYTDGQGFSEEVATSPVEVDIKTDEGDAVFSIIGEKFEGDTLSISESSADPDGTGTLSSYIWQSSSDGITWTQIGTDSTYKITSSEKNKKIRAIISYTDNQGFSETVNTSSIDVLSKVYNISTAINSPQEGYTLTTTSNTENVAAGSTLYWSISGTGITLSDFATGSLTGSGTVGSDGTFSFNHLLANDGLTEGYETIDIKLFSDSEMTNQVGETKSVLIRDSAIEEKIADIVEDVNGVKQIVSQLIEGQNYTLSYIKDFDGNLHANTGDVSDATKTSYKYQGLLDVNADGIKEAIYTNKESGRWVTASVNSETGQIDYTDYGKDGTTRIVGIYIDPLVESGDVIKNSAHDSQRRFQNDLAIDNLIVKKAGDFDSDNFQEVFWKTNDGTAYLRALMHVDGNIQYANYQSKDQMSEYLTANGYESVISDIV